MNEIKRFVQYLPDHGAAVPLVNVDEPRPWLGAESKTTAYHTLMRGLDTAGPFFVLASRCLVSRVGSVFAKQTRLKKRPTRIA
jgi:hypothetical protein